MVQPGQLASDPTTGLVYWFDQYQSFGVAENEIEYVNGSVGQLCERQCGTVHHAHHTGVLRAECGVCDGHGGVWAVGVLE